MKVTNQNEKNQRPQEISSKGFPAQSFKTKFEDLIIQSESGNLLTPIILELVDLSNYISRASLSTLESNLNRLFTTPLQKQFIENQTLVEVMEQLSQEDMDPAHISSRLKQEILKYETGELLFQKFKESFRMINTTLKHEILNELSVVATNLSLYEKTSNKKFLNDIYLIIDKMTNLIEKLEELEVFLIE